MTQTQFGLGGLQTSIAVAAFVQSTAAGAGAAAGGSTTLIEGTRTFTFAPSRYARAPIETRAASAPLETRAAAA